MADSQAASAGSPPQGAGATAAPSDWEAQKKRYESQIQGLSQERNQYKGVADAWVRLAQDPAAQGAIQYGPDGLPRAWDLSESAGAQSGSPAPYVQHPFAELGVDPNAANQWVQAQTQAVIASQGYITREQAQTLANQAVVQAYQMANHRFTTQRSVDKLLSDPLYKGLGDPNSDWAKRTAAYVQQYQAGKPARDGVGWDEWEFTGPQVLQQAADITYAQMSRESLASQATQNQAIQNQQAAGIAAGQTSAPVPITPDSAFEKAVQGGTDSMWESVKAQTEANWQQKGLINP